jgi:formylglycine-generating enzyme required for sulfatase activity
VVPPGDFTMVGEAEFEKPAHRVAIRRPFAIGRHEVTFAQWDACAAAGACKADIDDHGFGRGDRPVIDVSYDEVQAFLRWLSAQTRQTYRLPSEAEWEYAARAGSTTPFWWGAAAGNGRANCEDCSPAPPRRTLPVGSFRPNGFGLYDTAGNAAEWVEDCWNPTYRGAPADGAPWRAGQCQLRVLRGGSFTGRAAAVRSGARFRYDRDIRYYANGFRVVRDLP